MSLHVYNTLTRAKEPFQTVEPGKVRMYLCGPTVYKPAHIGHMVGPVIFDTVKRYLAYRGYDVTFVVNITDVDDKLINKARDLGKEVKDLAQEMTEDYFDNLRLMGVETIDQFPYATDHIGDMLDMIGKLVEKDAAYPLDGDVYFSVQADEDYGKLSGRNPDEMMAGTRAETKTGKRHPADFALWKGSKPGEPAWDSPWGPGRPGWHIECSAMAAKILGEEIDIHGGGLDLMFPHHENELAQSETCHGHPFARYWMHNGLMQAGGASKVGGAHSKEGDKPAAELSADEQVAGKLAGSAGAESIKTAVFAHHAPEAVRMFLLSTHYRSPIDFRLENISNTEKSMEGFARLFETFERITGTSFYDLDSPTTAESTTDLSGEPADFLADLKHERSRFLEAMDDDFNTGGAVGVLFDLRRLINGFIHEHKLETAATDEQKRTLTQSVTLLRELAGLLGLFAKAPEKAGGDDGFADALMDLILELREDMRAEKNWGAADKIRDALNALNVVVEDGAGGARWSRK